MSRPHRPDALSRLDELDSLDQRRREGMRGTVIDIRPTRRVKVTAHHGDDYQPPLVAVWRGDGEREVWDHGPEMLAGEARALAAALLVAADAIEDTTDRHIPNSGGTP